MEPTIARATPRATRTSIAKVRWVAGEVVLDALRASGVPRAYLDDPRLEGPGEAVLVAPSEVGESAEALGET